MNYVSGIKATFLDRIKLRATLFLIMACSIPAADCIGGTAITANVSNVYLLPDSSQILPGESCTLSVMVDDGIDSLSCVYCEITYDSTILDCVSASEGGLYSGSSYSTFFDWSVPVPGRVILSDCVLGYRSFIIAPGELYRLVFEGKDNGKGEVVVDSVTVNDIDRIEVDTTRGGPVRIFVGDVTAVNEMPSLPASLICHPNPFNPLTTLTFFNNGGIGPPAGSGRLEVYSIDGKIVRDIYRGRLKSGSNEFIWNGRDNSGSTVAAGVYVAAMRAGGTLYTRKMILVR